MPSTPDVPQLQHTFARPMPAYVPPSEPVRRRWIVLIAALVLTGLTSLSFKPVCEPDAPGVNETGSGVRHERRGTVWYHCEPWIRRVLTR
jgi:hypothetical protein